MANLATTFQDLVAKVKNLVTLAPVSGAISRPDLYSLFSYLLNSSAHFMNRKGIGLVNYKQRMRIKLKECVDNDLISRVICNISIQVQLWKANQIAWTVRVSVFWKTQSADLSQFAQFELCSCMWIIYMCSISKNVTAVPMTMFKLCCLCSGN